jgi:hypothetical protein
VVFKETLGWWGGEGIFEAALVATLVKGPLSVMIVVFYVYGAE